MYSFVHRQEELLISDGKIKYFQLKKKKRKKKICSLISIRSFSELKLSWLIGDIDLSVDCRIVGSGAELEWSRFSLLQERKTSERSICEIHRVGLPQEYFRHRRRRSTSRSDGRLSDRFRCSRDFANIRSCPNLNEECQTNAFARLRSYRSILR